MGLLDSLLASVVWNSAFEDAPAGGDSPSFGDDQIRELKESVRERVTKEHTMNLASGAPAEDGWHRLGSAKIYYGADAPTQRPDTATALSASDNGRLWCRSSDRRFYIYVHPDWVALSTINGADNTLTGDNTFDGDNVFNGSNEFSVHPTVDGSDVMDLDSEQTVTEEKTFAVAPVILEPRTDMTVRTTTGDITVPDGVYKCVIYAIGGGGGGTGVVHQPGGDGGTYYPYGAGGGGGGTSIRVLEVEPAELISCTIGSGGSGTGGPSGSNGGATTVAYDSSNVAIGNGGSGASGLTGGGGGGSSLGTLNLTGQGGGGGSNGGSGGSSFVGAGGRGNGNGNGGSGGNYGGGGGGGRRSSGSASGGSGSAGVVFVEWIGG